MAQYGKAPRHNAGFLALRSSGAFRKSDGKIPEVPRRKTLVRFQGLIPIRLRKCQFFHGVEDCLARFSKPGTGTDERRCGKALGRRMEGSPDSQHGYFESPSARHRSGHRRRRGRASRRESQAGRRAPATPARFGRTLLGAVAGGRPAAPQSTNGRAQPTARLVNWGPGVLSTMRRLANENGKLVRVPAIRKLREAEPRCGVFEEEQFKAVRGRLPADLHGRHRRVHLRRADTGRRGSRVLACGCPGFYRRLEASRPGSSGNRCATRRTNRRTNTFKAITPSTSLARIVSPTGRPT